MSAKPTRSRSEIEEWLDGFLRNPEFLEAYPYYAAILAKLIPVADPSVSRMAVSLHDGQFYLHVNVDSFMAEPQYLRGVLLHEVHHVVLGHLTHSKFTEVEEPELMDLAVEMSANEYIEEPLPPAVTWRAYSSVGMRAGQSTRERYEILVRHLQGTGSRPKPGAGEQGSGVVDDHRFLGKGATSPGGVAQTALLVSRAVEQARAERKERGEHPNDPQDEDDDEDAVNVPRRFLVAGRTAGALVEELSETVRAPQEPIDWRAALAMFVAQARAPVHTWSRPNRRFPGRIFEVPGRSWAPRRTENPRLLVAIDTSLSMTKYELEEIARQLVLLGERAHITIAECDVSVARVYPFDGRIENVVGRGGTDLRPVFAPSLLGAHDVDGVVYFTDGDGPYDREPPPVPTLWILTKPQAFRCPWGEKARLREPR
ncbi:MAG TPA: VWA-like domain-containing protein [Labilithrix sp.]|nr:VWA-like domain-containing protein [Labilithrix sp.]